MLHALEIYRPFFSILNNILKYNNYQLASKFYPKVTVDVTHQVKYVQNGILASPDSSNDQLISQHNNKMLHVRHK